jgi:cytochrome c peroxidase
MGARPGLLGLLLVGCGAAGGPKGEGGEAAGYAWDLPPGFPAPVVPDDNPMTREKVELGRHLFYDERLSVTGDTACATCHEPALAFTDGLAVAEGATGERHRRGAMSLVNVAYVSGLTWVNPLMRTLEKQAMVPLFGTEPVEMGLEGIEGAVLDALAADPVYQGLWPAAFPAEPGADSGDGGGAFTLEQLVMALAAFERTLVSGDSPYDRYLNLGDTTAMSQEARDGMALFFSERLECYHCHGTFLLSDSVAVEGAFAELYFHNTGLYNLDGQGAYPLRDQGLYEHTTLAADMGRFRAPSLRNIALTAPYMHDGSISDLDGVIDHYAAGGRTVAAGPDAGAGSESPLKSYLLRGFELSAAERAQLKAFLESLTDAEALADPDWQDPW